MPRGLPCRDAGELCLRAAQRCGRAEIPRQGGAEAPNALPLAPKEDVLTMGVRLAGQEEPRVGRIKAKQAMKR